MYAQEVLSILIGIWLHTDRPDFMRAKRAKCFPPRWSWLPPPPRASLPSPNNSQYFYPYIPAPHYEMYAIYIKRISN